MDQNNGKQWIVMDSLADIVIFNHKNSAKFIDIL